MRRGKAAVFDRSVGQCGHARTGGRFEHERPPRPGRSASDDLFYSQYAKNIGYPHAIVKVRFTPYMIFRRPIAVRPIAAHSIAAHSIADRAIPGGFSCNVGGSVIAAAAEDPRQAD